MKEKDQSLNNGTPQDQKEERRKKEKKLFVRIFPKHTKKSYLTN